MLNVANHSLVELTREDWATASQLADLLGVPVDELVRDFLEEWDRLTLEERTEFERAVERANEVLPELHATLDRIGEGISNCGAKVREMRARMVAMSERVSSIEETLGIVEPR